MAKKNIIKITFMQIMCSPFYVFCVLSSSLVFFVSIKIYIDDTVSVSYLVDLFLGLAMPKKLIVLLAAISCSTTFCSDWNFQYIQPVVFRCGIKKYVYSKFIASFVSAFFISFCGISFSCVILMKKFPLFDSTPLNSDLYLPFASSAKGSIPSLYIYALIAVFSLAVSAWVCVGLTISAYIPNHFVAFTSAIVASYILEEFTTLLPPFLDLYRITASRNVINQGAIISFVYFFAVFFLFSCIGAFVFYRQVGRRIRNEVI